MQQPNDQKLSILLCVAEELAEHISTVLVSTASPYAIEHASDIRTLTDKLDQQPWSAVVLQYELAGSNASSAVQRVRGQGYRQPLILIGGKIGERAAAEALRAGAQDYLLTDDDPQCIADALVRELAKEEQRRFQRQQEAEHAISHVFLRNVVDTVPVEIVVRDAGSRILFANDAFAATYGRKWQEVIGKRDADLWAQHHRPPEEIAAWLAEDREVLEQGVVKDYVQEIRRPSGEIVYFHNVKKPITLANGARCVLAMYSNITERKRVEEELRDTHAQAAELAGIHKTTATYAHEISNPLTGLMGLIQMLIDEPCGPKEAYPMLLEMRNAAKRISEVLRKLQQLELPKTRSYLGREELLDLDDDE